MSPKPSMPASTRPRRGAIAVILALGAGLLAACDGPSASNAGPWTGSITEPLARLQLPPEPPANFRLLTFGRIPAQGVATVFTREVTRAAPNHTQARAVYANTVNTCFVDEERASALGFIFLLGLRATQSNCNEFSGWTTTGLQATGRLFPATPGNSVAIQGQRLGRDGRPVTLLPANIRIEASYQGISLNGLEIGGPVHLISHSWQGGREAYLWSELLGHWVVLQGFDSGGSVTQQFELVAASGVEPRTLGGARAELRGGSPPGGPEVTQMRLLLARLQQRPDMAGIVSSHAALAAAQQRADSLSRRAQSASGDATAMAALSTFGAGLGSRSPMVGLTASQSGSSQGRAAELQDMADEAYAQVSELSANLPRFPSLASLSGPAEAGNPTAPRLGPPLRGTPR